MLTILPVPRPRMWGMARRARRIGPSTIVSIARRASSSETSSIAPLAATPALLTRPKGLSWSITALHSPASVTSRVTVRTLTPAARAARVTLRALEGVRTPPTGVKPRRASSISVASPIPVPAPVTSTVRSESDGRVSLIGHSRGGVLAKVLSSRMPVAVEQVIGLGSPFANQLDVAALTNVAVGVIRAAGELRYGRTFHTEGRFAHELR